MVSIGQGTLTATPLQVARAIAVIATGGNLLTPRLVMQAGDFATERATSALPVPGLSRQTLQAVRQGMEHAVSDELVDRMDEYLGKPPYDPHGDPIPRADGTMRGDTKGMRPLSQCEAGACVRIARVLTQSPDFLRHLAGAGLTLGIEVEVVENSEIGGTVTVRTGGRKTQTLGHTAAAQLLVTPADVAA